MKKITLLTAMISCLFAFSCASMKGKTETSTMPYAFIDLGSMDRSSYIILGTVSGECTLTADTSDIEQDLKNKVENIYELNSYKIAGDNANYGFVGEAKENLTVLERAKASATYKMIELARYNGADALAFVNTTVSTDTKNSFASSVTDITVKVSALAVKLKADEGYEIQSIPEPEPEPEPEVASEEPSAEESEVSEESSEAGTAETATEN